jgi:hypothetical protein
MKLPLALTSGVHSRSHPRSSPPYKPQPTAMGEVEAPSERLSRSLCPQGSSESLMAFTGGDMSCLVGHTKDPRQCVYRQMIYMLGGPRRWRARSSQHFHGRINKGGEYHVEPPQIHDSQVHHVFELMGVMNKALLIAIM